jgi:amino acid efflux transporter
MALAVKNQPGAPQHLTTSRGAALYIGALLGPGLLLLPGLAVAEAGPASILAWLGLLILSGLFAAVFSALGRQSPSAGGVIGYVTAGLGSRAGLATGWMFLAGVVCGAPIVCLIGASYVTALTGGGQLARAAVAALLLLTVVGLAAGGLRASAAAQLVLVGLLIGVVVVAAAGSAGTARAGNWAPFAPHGWLPVGSAASTLMFSFVGWEAVAPLTTRFADPGRQLPRVVAIALAVTTVLYLGLAIATISVLGPRAATDVPLAGLLSHAVGAAGRDVAAVAAVVLTLGATNAYINGAAAMAGQLVRAAPGRRASGPVLRLLAAITAAGLLLVILYGLRIVSTAALVAVPTALFLAVYLGAMAAAARVLRGPVRLAAGPAALAVVVMLGFCGWALAVPAAVALAVGWRARAGARRSRRSARSACAVRCPASPGRRELMPSR